MKVKGEKGGVGAGPGLAWQGLVVIRGCSAQARHSYSVGSSESLPASLREREREKERERVRGRGRERESEREKERERVRGRGRERERERDNNAQHHHTTSYNSSFYIHNAISACQGEDYTALHRLDKSKRDGPDRGRHWHRRRRRREFVGRALEPEHRDPCDEHAVPTTRLSLSLSSWQSTVKTQLRIL